VILALTRGEGISAAATQRFDLCPGMIANWKCWVISGMKKVFGEMGEKSSQPSY
jgi:hypothetical protein